LIAFVAAELGVPKARVAVAKGERSRAKLVVVSGECDPTRLAAGG
jgi:uncharacterized protein YggU (UPF0235/DUF167 family)